MPAEIAQKLDANLAGDATLEWETPISGAMRL
jgi:hypothetical protein